MVSGLRAAHEAGVVHRDLKPANIMIDAHDEARIMDFGIARSTSHATVDEKGEADPTGRLAELRRQAAVLSNQTMEGAIVGTVEYMAPEQAKGKPVDQRADIYALGLIVYDMLGGLGRAARSESAIVELTGRMEQPPPPIREINPDVPEALAKVIARCLSRTPDARYATTKDLEADLQRLDSEGNLLPVLRRVTSRQLAAAALLVLSLLGGTWWLARGPAPVVEHEPCRCWLRISTTGRAIPYSRDPGAGADDRDGRRFVHHRRTRGRRRSSVADAARRGHDDGRVDGAA